MIKIQYYVSAFWSFYAFIKIMFNYVTDVDSG